MPADRQRIKEMEVMVAEVIPEAHDSTTLVLFTGNDTLSYEPGNFLTVAPQQFSALQRWVEYLEDLKGRKEPPRAYSMSSSPDERYLAFTVKEERYLSGSTKYPPLLSPILARRMYAGAKMTITGFTGPYTLREEHQKGADVALHICAGSGIVPSFSIIKHDLRVNEKLKHVLLYSNKKFEDIIFFRQLAELEKEYPDRLQVIHSLTRDQVQDDCGGKIRTGRIKKELISEFISDPLRTAVLACGPDHTVWQKKAAKEKSEELAPSFMQSVLGSLDELGVPKNMITKESYG